MKNFSILRGRREIHIDHIKGALTGSVGSQWYGRGFSSTSESTLVGRYLKCTRIVSLVLGETVKCTALGGGLYRFEHSLKPGDVHHPSGLVSRVHNDGRMSVMTKAAAEDDVVLYEEPVQSPPPAAPTPTVSVEAEVGDSSTPDVVEQPGLGVKTNKLLALIPDKGVTAVLRDKNVIPPSPPGDVNYQALDSSTLGAEQAVAVLTHLAAYSEEKGIEHMVEYLTKADAAGKVVPVSLAEFHAAKNLQPIPGDVFISSNLKAPMQEGVDVQTISNGQQTAFEDAVTSVRVVQHVWHSQFVSITNYNPIAGSSFEAFSLNPEAIETMPSDYGMPKVGTFPQSKVPRVEVGVYIALGVMFPATFKECVKASSSPIIGTKAGAQPQGAQDLNVLIEKMRSEVAGILPALVKGQSDNIIVKFVRTLIAYSRTSISQPDRFNYGARPEDMLVCKACINLMNRPGSVVTTFAKNHTDLPAVCLIALNQLIVDAQRELELKYDLIRISRISASDLPANLAVKLQQERDKQASPSLRAQLNRRFMVAYRAALLFMSVHNRGMFNSLVKK